MNSPASDVVQEGQLRVHQAGQEGDLQTQQCGGYMRIYEPLNLRLSYCQNCTQTGRIIRPEFPAGL